MEWAIEDLSLSSFLINFGQQSIGQLQFERLLSYNASFNMGEHQIDFLESNNKISIVSRGETIGKINYNLFGQKKLTLKDNSRYFFKHNFFGRNVRWLDAAQNTYLELKQPTFHDIGRGQAIISDDLSDETNILLVSSALYLHNLYSRKSGVYVIFFIPILIALSLL